MGHFANRQKPLEIATFKYISHFTHKNTTKYDFLNHTENNYQHFCPKYYCTPIKSTGQTGQAGQRLSPNDLEPSRNLNPNLDKLDKTRGSSI